MNTDYVLRMANQIADALGINPDQEQAVRDLADHLNRFWEPRMRGALLTLAATPDGAARLSPLVCRAVGALRPPP